MNNSSQKYQINPAYLSDDSEDPVRIVAGKVLEENKLKKEKPVTKVPLVFRLLLLLVAAIAVIALVCSLLFYTGEVVPESTNVRPKQDPQAGFGLSNQQLFDAVVALQKRVKELEDANATTRGIISDLTEQKDVDTLQQKITDAIDKCTNFNRNLTLKFDALQTIHQNDGKSFNKTITNMNAVLSRVFCVTNFAQCSIKVNESTPVPGNSSAAVNVTMTPGKNIIDFHCSSNIAAQTSLRFFDSNKYGCTCRGQGNFNDTEMICYANIVECDYDTRKVCFF